MHLFSSLTHKLGRPVLPESVVESTENHSRYRRFECVFRVKDCYHSPFCDIKGQGGGSSLASLLPVVCCFTALPSLPCPSFLCLWS